MTAPEGWDQPPEEIIAGARDMRVMFIALQMAGFTANEAINIIAATIAHNLANQP